MKKGSGKAKGSKFEREICVRLSLWWTNGENDSVFWRTDSGARATQRGKKGKTTRGQHGDIVATDAIGGPLLDLITFELKNGYKKHSVADIFDASDKQGPTLYEQWIEQAKTAADLSGSKHWALITKRDRREILMIVPFALIQQMTRCPQFDKEHFLCHTLYLLKTQEEVFLCRFDEWCNSVTKKTIEYLLNGRA